MEEPPEGESSHRNQLSSVPGGVRATIGGCSLAPAWLSHLGSSIPPFYRCTHGGSEALRDSPQKGWDLNPFTSQALHAQGPSYSPTCSPHFTPPEPRHPHLPYPSLSTFQPHGRFLLYPQSPLQCLEHSRLVLRCGSMKGILP